jgi:DNA polymerase I
MLDVMARAKTIVELEEVREEVMNVYREAVTMLPTANPKSMAITRRISRLKYAHRCLEGAAVETYRNHGVEIASGMKIQYVVRNARRYLVEPVWCADSIDVLFYRSLIDKAWAEISYAFGGK